MKYKKPSPRDLRRVNRAEILRKIYFEGPISRLEVSQEIGISPATVTNIVNDLLGKKILIESGIKQSEGGRPSTFIKINPNYGYFIGIEVGETFIQVELFDILFNFCQKAYFPLNEVKISPRQIVQCMVQGIKDVIQQSNLTEEEIIGVGIGFPGLVDPNKGVSIFTPNWGWHDVSITSQLRERLSIPMYIDNGAKAMAIGEMHFGAGKGANNMAVLLVGTGVGSGIIHDRVLFRGSVNNAGEFGHTSLNITGPKCRCGSNGCMEMYIGANGIIDRYCNLKTDPHQPPTDDQIAFIKYLIAESKNGNQEAIQTIHETILYMGVSIANLINAVNPEILLLGGWSGLIFGNEYMDQLQTVVSKYALEQSLAKTHIRLCQLGQDAGAKGAAALVLEHFFVTGDESETIMVGGRQLGK